MIKAFRWNFVVLGITLAILAWICWSYLFFPAGYASVMDFWKVDISTRPYLPFCDISEELSAAQCTRTGIQIYPINFCDIWQRAHSYPVMMERWNWLFPDPTHLMLVGLVLAVATVFTVSFSSRLRSIGETCLLVLLLASPTVAFALERANMDVAMLLLFALAALSAAGRWIVASDLVILFAGFMKFYPIVAIGMVFTQSPRKAFLLFSATMLVFAGYLYEGRRDFLVALSNMVDGKWPTADFGARETYTVIALISKFFTGPHMAYIVAGGACILIFVAIVICALQISTAQQHPPKLASYSELSFFIGGVTIWAVFLVSDNIAYRGVLLLLLLPLLFQRRHSEAKSDRFMANALLGSISLILWLPALYFPSLAINERLLLFWLAKEPLWFLSLGMIASLVFLQAKQFPLSVKLIHSYQVLVHLNHL